MPVGVPNGNRQIPYGPQGGAVVASYFAALASAPVGRLRHQATLGRPARHLEGRVAAEGSARYWAAQPTRRRS